MILEDKVLDVIEAKAKIIAGRPHGQEAERQGRGDRASGEEAEAPPTGVAGNGIEG